MTGTGSNVCGCGEKKSHRKKRCHECESKMIIDRSTDRRRRKRQAKRVALSNKMDHAGEGEHDDNCD